MIELDGIQMSDSEKEAIDKLRENLAPLVDQATYDDTYLFYRFLNAHNFNVDNADNAFRKMLLWRKQMKIDTIVEDYELPEVLQLNFGKTIFGYSKSGVPVHYNSLGKMDSKGLLMSCKYSDIEKTIFKITERDERYLKKNRKIANGPYPGYIFIYDLEGLDFAKATDKKAIETTIRILPMYQKYYPGRIGTIYIINASAFFYFPFNIVKNFLDESMLKTIRIFGTDGWKSELLEMMDADQLPAFLGGNRTDPDGNPLCKTIVQQSERVDDRFYLQKSSKSLSTHPDAKKLLLSRASFLEMEIEVSEAGTLIEWEFETKSRDIGFGLFYKDADDKIDELVPLLRLDTDSYAETGMYKCDKSGTYVMVFDNSYSWVRSKEIYYRTKIISPTEYENQMQQ